MPRAVELRWELDDDNLVTTCISCHNIKRHWEDYYYGLSDDVRGCVRSVPIKDYKLLKFLFETSQTCADLECKACGNE